MLATLVIGLREGLEASLIVGIIAAFLRRNGRPLRAMWVGVGAAVLLAVLVGVVLQAVEANLPQAAQEAMESVIGAVAVLFVTSMIIWMSRHARSLRTDLEASAGAALHDGTTSALAVMAFLAVLKEGFETSVFLLATFSASTSSSLAATGAVVGILASVAIGWGIYRGGVHLDLGRFFRVTGVFLVFVAAGLVLTCLRTAHEAGWIRVGQQPTLDLSWLAPRGSVRAALMTGVLGIPADPRLLEVIGWGLYLVPVLALVLWPASRRPRASSVPLIKSTAAGALALSAVVLAVAVPAAAGVPSGPLPLVGASGARVGTASLTGADDRTLLLRTGAQEQRTALAGGAVSDERGGVAATRWDSSRTSTPAGAPATVTLAELLALAGGRLPVGVDPRADPGPFTATWTTRTSTSAWVAGGVLVDATRSASTVVVLSGGGLTTPRTLTASPTAASTTSSASTMSSASALPTAALHASPRAVASRTHAIATSGSAAAERDLWRLDLPLVLAVAALLLALSGLRDVRRLRGHDHPADVRRSPVVRPLPSTIRS